MSVSMCACVCVCVEYKMTTFQSSFPKDKRIYCDACLYTYCYNNAHTHAFACISALISTNIDL